MHGHEQAKYLKYLKNKGNHLEKDLLKSQNLPFVQASNFRIPSPSEGSVSRVGIIALEIEERWKEGQSPNQGKNA